MPVPRLTNRPLVIASVMAAMFMVAIEATIIATALPRIVGELGGLHLYSWVFSAFLLAQTATSVVFGKLADTYGRKPVLLVGIAIFLVGSLVCGLADSMPAMIGFRLIQGMGAGAIQPVAITIVGDLYPVRERGKVQGYLASVWAFSAVIGPMAGALIIETLSWPWLFWINIPIGLAAAAGFVAFLHENVPRERRPVDVLGALLFAASVSALMAALTEIGASDWRNAWILGILFAVALVLFLLQERRAVEPMIAMRLWGRPAIALANGSSLLAGMALIGLTSFLPMYVQGVLGRSAVVAGLAMTMTVLGWPIGATLGARIAPRFGLRRVMLVASGLLPLGAAFFLVLEPGSSPALAAAGSLVMGFGMGLLSVCSLMLIQEIADWSERGAATASNIFSRNLGSTLGATVLGAILNYGLARFGAGGAITSDRLRSLLESGAALDADATLRAALHQSLHLTFSAVLAIALLIVFLVWRLPTITLGRAGGGPSEKGSPPPAN